MVKHLASEADERRRPEPWPAGLATVERFWRFVQQTEDCWLWTGAKDKQGRGQFTMQAQGVKRTVLCHRLAYELCIGPIPPGLSVLHRCSTRECVRPEHLFLGTFREQKAELIQQGRWPLLPGQIRSEHPRHGLGYNPSRAARGERHGLRRHPERVRPRSVLTAERARQVIPLRLSGLTYRAIAQQLGVSPATVWLVAAGRTWRATTGDQRDQEPIRQRR